MPDPTADQMQSAIDTQASSPPPSAVAPCKKLTWVEIKLVDMEGNPVSNVAYRITTPEQNVVSGKLGKDGVGRVDGIQPGTCQITFPDLDADAWEWV